MTQEEINFLILGIVEIEKNAQKDKVYHSTFQKECDMACDVSVHTSMEFPTRLFKAKAPNEDKEQFEYRKNTYRPITSGVWNRMVQETNRIWNPSNYEIAWPDESKIEETVNGKTSSQMKYFSEEYPHYKSILTYFRDVVTKWKVKDPNAVLCVNQNVPMVMDGDEMKVIDNELTSPYAIIYGCERIRKFTDDYSLIELPEKSMVKVGNTDKKEGLVYELRDKSTIYRIAQTGKKEKWIFETTITLQHNLNNLLCWKLKGIPENCDDTICYKSIFYDAVAPLDTALYDSSTLDIAKAGAAFPHRWAITENCTHQGCTDGYVYEGSADDGTLKQVKCPDCKGTGKKSMFSPMGVFEVRPGSATEEQVPTPPFGFVEPNGNTLEFLRKEIDSNKAAALAVAGVNVSNSKISGDETATGRLIDREALFAIMIGFAAEMFDLLKDTIKSIGSLRYGEGFHMPVISPPVTVAMRTEDDLTREMDSASKAKMPDMVRRRMIKEYISTRFTNSQEMEKITDIVIAVDSLAMSENADILAGVGVGVIHKWQAILHQNIYGYIDDLMEVDKEFLEKDLREIKKDLIAKAKLDVPQSQFSAESLLNVP